MERRVSHTADIDRWFKSEVLWWRRFVASLWTVLLCCPFLYCTLAIANINVFHPVNWIIEGLIRFGTPFTWGYVLVVMAMAMLLSRQNSRKLTVVPVIHVSRWNKLAYVLHPSSIYSVLITAVICAVITWCYVRLVAGMYHHLSTPCLHNSSEWCLNEHHLFVILHGFYAGLQYRLTTTISGHNYMAFSVIQQSKFFQVKGSILAMMRRSIYITLDRLRYFYILYYLLLGSVVKQFLATKIGLNESSSETAINTLRGMLDASLLWHCTLSGSYLHFLLSLSTKIQKLCHTEWFHFPVETSVELSKNLCLHNALECEKNTLLQYHGYQDLYLLSRHSPRRRLQLFSLTDLGGHPQNWLQVSQQCLQLLHKFNDELTLYNNKIMANGTISQAGPEKTTLAGDLRHRKIISENIPSANGKPKQPPLTQKFVAKVKKYRVVGFFLAQDVEAHSRKLFAKAQLYIWAVEALSFLVCASFDEDRFGVVQKSLQQIMESILTLQEQVEKHFRLIPNLTKHFDRSDDKESDVPLRGALRMTLKTAIYRIVSRFGIHIKSVPLSSDHQRCLSHFVEYKE